MQTRGHGANRLRPPTFANIHNQFLKDRIDSYNKKNRIILKVGIAKNPMKTTMKSAKKQKKRGQKKKTKKKKTFFGAERLKWFSTADVFDLKQAKSKLIILIKKKKANLIDRNVTF
jgi:hypothetical protein